MLSARETGPRPSPSSLAWLMLEVDDGNAPPTIAERDVMTRQFKVCDPVFIRPLGRRGIITWVHGAERPLYRVASYGEIRLFEASTLAPLEPLMRLVVSNTPASQELGGQCA